MTSFHKSFQISLLKKNLVARSCALVDSVKNLHNLESVLCGCDKLCVTVDAINKVLHLSIKDVGAAALITNKTFVRQPNKRLVLTLLIFCLSNIVCINLCLRQGPIESLRLTCLYTFEEPSHVVTEHTHCLHTLFVFNDFFRTSAVNLIPIV